MLFLRSSSARTLFLTLIVTLGLSGCIELPDGIEESQSESPRVTADHLTTDTALLKWNAPFTRENGASLSMGEIAGYEISYGLSLDAMDNEIRIERADADAFEISGLTNGAWHFAIRTVDTDGVVSRNSKVVYKVIRNN